jgi:hypothetical protein
MKSTVEVTSGESEVDQKRYHKYPAIELVNRIQIIPKIIGNSIKIIMPPKDFFRSVGRSGVENGSAHFKKLFNFNVILFLTS